MNNRIKEIREAVNLSRAKFGDKLGLSGDVINNLERGRIEIKDDRILSICRTFNVNENWLRTGEGEMFLVAPIDEEIATFIGKIQMDDKNNFKKRFIAMLSKLDESEWGFLEQKAKEIVGYGKKMD